MYVTQNIKVACFTYNKKVYQAGTKILYSGQCIINNNKRIVNNIIVSFMYYDGEYVYCKHDNTTCKLLANEFKDNIIKIIGDENKSPPTETKEFYWTDDMVAKTIWYILIMIVGTIFHDRIGIWVLATFIWYFSTFKKK